MRSVVPRANAPQGAVARGTMADAGVWDYHGTGLLLPRGTVVVTKPNDDADLADLRDRVEVESARRGVRSGGQVARKIKRSAADSAALESLSTWLSGHDLDLLGTVSFSDAVAASRGIYSLGRGLDVVAQELKAFRYHGKQGYRGKFVLCGEWHPSGRAVPHVHAVLSSAGATDLDDFTTSLWRHFFHNCGRSRFEPMRDQNDATLYGLKDTLKASASDANSMRLRLSRFRSYGKGSSS
jgi:hypothetical protein